MKKKILIIIPDEFMYRNYIKTDTFKLINQKYNCHFIYDHSISLNKKKRQDKIYYKNRKK